MRYEAKPLPPVELPELRQAGKPLRRVDALGKVVWARRTESIPSCGILFTKMRDIDKTRILSYFDSTFGGRLRKKIWWQDNE